MISLEEFAQYIQHIKNEDILFDKLYDAAQWYNNKTRGEFELMWFSELQSDVISLLEEIFNDDSEWIAYFCYDLSFGESYEEGAVTDVDGSPIKLATVEDLYNLLISKS